MINLLKMEWYRLRHSRLFGGLLLGIFIAGLFISASETEGQAVASAAAKGNGGVQLTQQMMSEAVPMGFLASIFGVIYLGQGFAERTPNLAVESGSGRNAVFLSKILIYLMVISLAMMVYILAGVMVAVVTLNFTGGFSRFRYKLKIDFPLSFHIFLNVRKALFYQLYGHFSFRLILPNRHVSSRFFTVNRGKYRGKTLSYHTS